MQVSTIVLSIHSIVRFVILLVALVGLIKAIIGSAQKGKADKADQVLAAAFVGLYDLQTLLGILIIFLGSLTQAIHPVVMFVGIIAAHVLQSMSKRGEGQQAGLYRLALYIVPLAIILFGLATIGRLPL
jgi:hypothetical protein